MTSCRAKLLIGEFDIAGAAIIEIFSENVYFLFNQVSHVCSINPFHYQVDILMSGD